MAERSSPSKSVTDSKVTVKKEDDSDSRDGHFHHFDVKFNPSDPEEYTIYCDQPRTVLEAIKSHKEYQNTKCADENIRIQLSMADKEIAVPTHFPCSCIEDGELLIISCESEKVEEAQNKPETVHPQDKYSVFYIESEGGKNTKTKKIFISKKTKKFKYVCVYGEKGMTVEEALKRDGRFIDDLGDFKLSDSENPEKLTGCKQMVDSLDGKKFKLCLPRKNKKDEKPQEKLSASNSSQHQNDSVPVVDVTQQRGTSMKTVEKSDSSVNGDVHESLKKFMEDHFPGDSYQKAVQGRMEHFGKIQQSFSEVHRVTKLLKLSESVCKVIVGDVCVGTGFLLFDNFILTNAHLFKGCVEEDRKHLQEDINVFALFNYDDPEPYTDYHCFSVKKTLIDFSDGELDYAVLELNLEGKKANQTTETVQLPAGLLKRFGPVPQNGEACIIGHPKGNVKTIDPKCIIEKENRGKSVDDHLEPNSKSPITLCSIRQVIRNQGIGNILTGGSQRDNVVTYNTFTFDDSSGSPVFDAHCRVFGLHTAGFVYEFSNHTKSAIEFTHPLLSIFERLVIKIKESRNEELLNRVEEEAKGNPYLKKSFESVELNESSRVEKAKGSQSLEKSFKSLVLNEPEDSDEPMDSE